MTEIARIIVPVDINDANPNRRKNLRAHFRVVKQHRETARLAWIAAKKPVSKFPVELSVIVRRGRVLDQGNVWAALKHVIDGVFKNALTPDDSERWLTLGTITQETGRRFIYQPEVELIVTKLERWKGTIS